MADENVIGATGPKVKLDVKFEPKSEASPELAANPSDDGYEITHSRSPVFYDLYERKEELKHQTHY